MTELLLKLFVKNYKNTKDEAVRTGYGSLGAGFGLFTNFILFIGKIIVGLLINNISVIADAMNNLSDFGNNILTLFGFKFSSKPADKDHPYGHQRMEYIISMIISIVIIALGLNIGYQAVLNIINPESVLTSFPTLTIIVLSISIVIKIIQALLYYSLGKRIDSIALQVTGTDSRNDVLATSGVLAGLIISYYTGFTRIDGIIAIVVAFLVVYSGVKILLKTADLLLGEKPSDQVITSFIKIIKSDPAVKGLHDLEMHCYGPNSVYASVHVEVDGSVNVFISHDMIDNLERKCNSELGIKTVIHMDPIKINDPETEHYKKIVTSAVMSTNSELSLHDFRIVSGPTHTNAVFDIIIPHSLKKDQPKILHSIRDIVKKADPNIYLVITCDDQYTTISSEND